MANSLLMCTLRRVCGKEKRGVRSKNAYYLGRLDESEREIIISKSFPSRFQEKIPLNEIRKMVAEGKDVLA